MNYGRAPFYGEMIEVVGQLIMLPENNIARFNCQAITKISGLLGLNTKRFHWSSNLPHKGSSNELLACLTRAVGAESYMYGGGADGYQDEQVFTTQGIRIIAQDFKHPVYQQARQNQFHAGLSVIDAVANLGWSATGRLLGTSK